VPAETADGNTDAFAADSFADSYTTLNAALQYRLDSQQGKIVLVTSSLRAEGKSALAAGLAAAAARSGRTTVLVDAAGPSAVQHDLFKVPCGQGLCGVLERKVGLLEAVQKTGIEHLDILTVGMGKDQLARRLADKSVGTMLGLLADRYDCVIVDSSCVLAGGSARLVAQHCDGVLLALAEGKSFVKGASRSVGSLQSVGANILGVVITHAQSAWAYDDALAPLNLQGASEPVRSNHAFVQKAPSL
jgi:capsular exopolysaccharide synthesis family protein